MARCGNCGRSQSGWCALLSRLRQAARCAIGGLRAKCRCIAIRPAFVGCSCGPSRSPCARCRRAVGRHRRTAPGTAARIGCPVCNETGPRPVFVLPALRGADGAAAPAAVAQPTRHFLCAGASPVRKGAGGRTPGRLIVLRRDGSDGEAVALAGDSFDIGRTEGSRTFADDLCMASRQRALFGACRGPSLSAHSTP